MEKISWFNSSDQVDTALVWVAVIGAIIEVALAVVAVINVHHKFEKARKETVERYIEIFACVAAFFFLAEAILGWRSSVLLGKSLESTKKDNLVLQSNVDALHLQLIETSNNMVKMNPINLPVNSIVVEVVLTMGRMEPYRRRFDFSGELTLSSTTERKAFDMVSAEAGVFIGSNKGAREYSLVFLRRNLGRFEGRGSQSSLFGKSAKSLGDTWNTLQLRLNDASITNAKVGGGFAIVEINGVIRKTFSIDGGTIANGSATLNGTSGTNAVEILLNPR